MSTLGERANAVIVDYRAGEQLVACVDSLVSNGVEEIVVVNNAEEGLSRAILGDRSVTIVEPRVNLGYGGGMNRGVAASANREFVLITNPDVVVHEGALDRLVAFLESRPDLGVLGPAIATPGGDLYPSVRVFPSFWLAGLHALCAPWWPNNPWTRRYRSPGVDGRVDWVSGACFLIRRELFERIGGFDERYFMFAEDMDLCWRARDAGAGVGAISDAVVTHVEGVSRQQSPRAMLIAHHRSAIRFELQHAKGWRRVLAPVAILVLLVRLCVTLCRG